jgi:hypothetical protein
MSHEMCPILIMLLVASSLCQFAIGLSNNCCADMPQIIADIQAESDSQQAQLDSQKKLIDKQQKEIDSLKGNLRNVSAGWTAATS